MGLSGKAVCPEHHRCPWLFSALPSMCPCRRFEPFGALEAGTSLTFGGQGLPGRTPIYWVFYTVWLCKPLRRLCSRMFDRF